MLLRSNRASTGDGLHAALAAGAALSESMDGFYGHLISSPSDVWTPGVYTRLSQYHSGTCALVNVAGDVFRPPFDNDHYNTQWTLKQPEGRAVLVMDQFRYEHQEAPTTIADPVNRFDIAVEHGAHAAVAPTLDELGAKIAEWGFAGDRLPDAIAAFNADATEERPALVEPPYYALEVRPAITFTHGGVKIDAHARVQSADGKVIPGLLAAGADAGGVFDGGYGGGLAAAGVFAPARRGHRHRVAEGLRPPSGCSSAMSSSRRRYFWILVADIGHSSTNRTRRGTLKLAMRPWQ